MCKNMTGNAADIAGKLPPTRPTYCPISMSRLLASAAVAPEHYVYGLNLDLARWSPSFELVPQLRRVKCVNDLEAYEVGNARVFILLRYKAVIFKQHMLLGDGISSAGFPMGWLPSLDSLMHMAWIDAAWADVQLKAQAEIAVCMRVWRCDEQEAERRCVGQELWPRLALDAAYTRAIQIDGATVQVEFQLGGNASAVNASRDVLHWLSARQAARRRDNQDNDDEPGPMLKSVGDRARLPTAEFAKEVEGCLAPSPHFEDAVMPPRSHRVQARPQRTLDATKTRDIQVLERMLALRYPSHVAQD